MKKIPHLLLNLSAILLIALTSCSFPKKEKCFQSDENGVYKILGITLTAKDKMVLAANPQCIAEDGARMFSAAFGVNHEEYKGQNGNTVVANISILLPDQKPSEEQIQNMVEIFASKPALQMLEIKKHNHPKFSVFSYDIGAISKKEKAVCKTFFSVIRDRRAPNLPAGIKYLEQKDFYKTCYLGDYKMIISAAISFRTTPSVSKGLDQNKISVELSKILKNLRFSNGVALGEVM